MLCCFALFVCLPCLFLSYFLLSSLVKHVYCVQYRATTVCCLPLYMYIHVHACIHFVVIPFIQELPHLKVVDLSHNKILNVLDLHMKIGNIAKLGLAHNQLASLEGIYMYMYMYYTAVWLAYAMYNIHVYQRQI